MQSPTGQAVTFAAFFTKNKLGVVPSSPPTVDVHRQGTSIVTSQPITSSDGNGTYYYTLSGGSTVTPGIYVAMFKTTDTTVDQQHVPCPYIIGVGLSAGLSAPAGSAGGLTRFTTDGSGCPVNVLRWLGVDVGASGSGAPIVDVEQINGDPSAAYYLATGIIQQFVSNGLRGLTTDAFTSNALDQLVIKFPMLAGLSQTMLSVLMGTLSSNISIFANSTGTYMWNVAASDGTPINEQGHDVEFLLHDKPGTTKVVLDPSNITIQRSDPTGHPTTYDQIKVVIPDSFVVTPANWYYKLWDRTSKLVIGTGRFYILVAPKP